MLKIQKSVITPFTAEQMYNLVSDIENYKHYLPWCPASKVISKDANVTVGRVDISYLKVSTSFTTKNINTPCTRIDLSLVDGPFKQLSGFWQFTQIGEKGCKIEFNLSYQFNNFIIEKVIGKVFEFVIKNIVDSFVKKANEIYR